MYIEANNRKLNDKARLISPVQQPVANGQRLQFWYHMYGRSMGSLVVYVKDNTRTAQVWKKSGNQGNQWQKGQVTLKSPLSYQVF